MGWTYTTATHFNGNDVDRKESCDCLINDEKHLSVVKSSMVGKVYYGAVRDDRTDEVFAMVILTDVCRASYSWEFGYKDMDESMIPCYYDCPVSILNLLSPTKNENSNFWRKACRDTYESKHGKKAFSNLKEGQWVRWTVPHNGFKNLDKGDKVLMVKTKVNGMKRCVWLIPSMGYIPSKNVDSRDYELVDGQ